MKLHPRIRKKYKFSLSVLFQSPARVSLLGLTVLIAAGTFLLILPFAATRKALGFVDALFTAVSASCVTGLVVVDTGVTLSKFGQLVVLAMIQIGGLGIMTISTLFILFAGRRPSLTGQVVVQDAFTRGGEMRIKTIVRDVILFTLVIEGLGAMLMFFRFFPDRSIVEAIYISIFHAVSAFCNAGFALFSDSFTVYRNDWVINCVISFLIISGGIGFLVLSELRRRMPLSLRDWSRVSLHSKLVLSTTVIILAASSLLIILMEWHNTLAPLSVAGRLQAGFFQAVSSRTAGFNTLPIEEMANETLFVFIVLMFIGASPGSCGGGIKTTSIASLVMLALSRLRGKMRVQIFRRTIPQQSIGKAVSVVLISATVVIIATLLLLISELGETPHPLSRGKFMELFFEVVSAFGTVGLSTGVTGTLSVAGKLTIACVMFIGRLGPLLIAMAVSRPQAPGYYFAEEGIMIG